MLEITILLQAHTAIAASVSNMAMSHGNRNDLEDPHVLREVGMVFGQHMDVL